MRAEFAGRCRAAVADGAHGGVNRALQTVIDRADDARGAAVDWLVRPWTARRAEPSGPVKAGRQVQLVGYEDSAGEDRDVFAGQTFMIPVQHHVFDGHATHAALPMPWYPQS